MPMERYYQRVRHELTCRIITPMFLGDAQQEAEWRAAPFKGLLRYWWRVTQRERPNYSQLLEAEGELFGFAGDTNSSKSLVQIFLPVPAIAASKNTMPTIGKIHHPEVDRDAGQINPLLYLAGMGLLNPNGSVKRAYFPPAQSFKLIIEFPRSRRQELLPTLALIQAFGAVGGRSRNGWGSLQISDSPVTQENAVQHLEACTRNWEEGFAQDYPSCLGKDTRGPLVWRTREARPAWQEAMRELAEVYVGVRARTVNGIPRLDPGGRDYPAERHLLGFPLTNHPANQPGFGWGGSGRHASPLHFVVKQKPNGFSGFILHLPFQHSTAMAFPGALNNAAGQQAVWRKVHQKLDTLLLRATYGDCL